MKQQNVATAKTPSSLKGKLVVNQGNKFAMQGNSSAKAGAPPNLISNYQANFQ